MDEMKNVKEICENHKEENPLRQKIAELEHMVRAQHQTITLLTDELQEKDEKLIQLEKLLAENVPVIKKDEQNAISFSISTEEEICEFQIRRLQQAAKVRDLTLDETRKLDILNKIKKSFQKDLQEKDVSAVSATLNVEDLEKLLDKKETKPKQIEGKTE